MPRLSALWIIPPIAVGAIVAFWFVARAPGPARVTADPPGLAVRVTSVSAREIRPVARGWGNVRAARTWTAVAEVKGQVIWRHPDLEAGKLIAAGTRILEIDPADYKLAIAQAEADLKALEAEAAQIDAEAENTARILSLEEARLALSEEEFARIRELVAQGTVAQSRVDEAERATLLARRTVVELKNALALLPSRRDRLDAQTGRTRAALARARRDLDHTVIAAPFDLRVTSVTAQEHQYVNATQTLAAGDGITQVEVVTQVPVATFRRLMFGDDTPHDVLAAMQVGPTARVQAEVRLASDPSQIWEGKVTRIEGALDPRARTVPVVVLIDAPYSGANPPLRMPLVPNMQVEVVLTGLEMPGGVAIPEAALHGDLAYVVDAAGRLELRPVTLVFRQDGMVVVADGLEIGERLVLDDIAPAIPGLRLNPIEVQE
ncbi:MAG: HlyD family efflux transporter periplasmic adaptor subunit [Notoacmeibacter sp.]|nr:HlyD family efflux transporter periplasmic adaptor subunit [Notoacmeibacter sp.]